MNRYAALHTSPSRSTPGPTARRCGRRTSSCSTRPTSTSRRCCRKPLEPTEPIVRINLAQVDMPEMTEPLQAGTFSVACRHGEIHGFYDLLDDHEHRDRGGRRAARPSASRRRSVDVALEHHGELGTVGAGVTGVMSRKGVDLIEVRGTVAEVLEPGPVTERFAFYYKFLLDPQGGGFDHDPTFVHVRRTQEDRVRRAARRRGHAARLAVRPGRGSPGEEGGRARSSPRTTRPRPAPSSARCRASGCGRTATSVTTV